MKPFALSLSMPLLGVAVLMFSACSGKHDPAAEAQPTGDQTPVATDQSAPPKSPWQGTETIKPVYPDEAASKNMNLDYESFQFEGNGLSVAPLPPYFARSVDVTLTDSARKYTLAAGRSECAYKVKVVVGEGEAKLLDPKQGEKFEIAADSFAGAASVVLHVSLEDGAQQNWSCNLHIEAQG